MSKNIEIERKFLVSSSDYKCQAYGHEDIIQGYLSSIPQRTVRVRIKGDNASLTIKGEGNESGATRFEWEKEISVEDARNLINLCEPGIIDKTRYLIKNNKHVFEVDEFHGENQGLTIAEIELNNEDEVFQKPSWLGKEVTGQVQYYNASLIKNPYKNWNKK